MAEQVETAATITAITITTTLATTKIIKLFYMATEKRTVTNSWNDNPQHHSQQQQQQILSQSICNIWVCICVYVYETYTNTKPK